MAVVVEVIRPELLSESEAGLTRVVEVVRGASSPIETIAAQATVEVVRPGGTVTNVQWGYGFPENPHEGQVWISVVE